MVLRLTCGAGSIQEQELIQNACIKRDYPDGAATELLRVIRNASETGKYEFSQCSRRHGFGTFLARVVKSLSAYTRVGGEFFILYSKSYTY